MIKNIEELVRARRSFRSYDPKAISAEDMDKLCAYLADIPNPYGQPVEFRIINGMSSPVVVGTDTFIAGKMPYAPQANEAFGYSFECMTLYALSLGIGTVCIGGTMDRPAFEKAVELAEGEFMPCITPIGYPAKKMSVRETMMRRGVKADWRMAFNEIVFQNDFNTPMTPDAAGVFTLPLEMVRLAPSAVNKQPWRMVVAGDMVHFYLLRSKGFNAGTLDMQKVDMGIALCHFDLAAKEMGMTTEFVVADPGIAADGMEYIASYLCIK